MPCRSRLIQTGIGRALWRAPDSFRILHRLTGDMFRHLNEIIQRLFRFRFRRLNHHGLPDDQVKYLVGAGTPTVEHFCKADRST
jgi:hypothetical protein